MAGSCFACGKKFGLLGYGQSLIEGRHELCSNCYNKIGSTANKFQFDSQKEDVDREVVCERYNEYVKAVKAAGYDTIVENALIEDGTEVLNNYNLRVQAEEERNQAIAKEKHVQIEKNKAMANILITSGFSFDGYKITKYSGYISGDDAIEVDRGATILSFQTKKNDQALTDALVQIRRQALKELKEAAFDLGCNAVIGVDFDYITLEPETTDLIAGGKTYLPYVFCVTANGNAVIIERDNSFGDVVDALKGLKELLDSGIITEAEYQVKKEELLGL